VVLVTHFVRLTLTRVRVESGPFQSYPTTFTDGRSTPKATHDEEGY